MEVRREWLEGVLKEDEAIRNLVRLCDVTSEPAVAAGDNYASAISRLQLGAVLGSGKKVQMSLILKKLPDNENQCGFLENHSFFSTEIKMYIEILPLLEDVLREQGIPALWPNFIGQKDNVLIFSDLKSKNYKVGCRTSRLDLSHSLLAIKTLALFHASSIALRERGQLDLTGLELTYFARGTRESRRLMSGGMRMAAKVIGEEWGPDWTDIAQKLDNKANTCCEEIEALATVDESRLNTLCHGDLWTTNLMFKYSRGVDTPIGVRFLDFQLSHYNSYAFDLIYFMVCSIPLHLRKKYRTLILQNYVNTLTESLVYLGYEDLAPDMATVEEETKRLELWNLLVHISIMPIVTATVKGALDFDKLTSNIERDIAQSPEIYKGAFKDEIQVELLSWANSGMI